METVISVLTVVLGLDTSLFVHFAIFGVSYLFLDKLIFTPYMQAYELRLASISSSGREFLQYTEDTKKLEIQYQDLAKNLNEKIKTIYNQSEQQTTGESQKIIKEARELAKKKLVETKKEIKSQQQIARDNLSQQIDAVALVISQKMLN